MRTEGNNKPDVILIETYMPRRGYVEARLTENPIEVTRTDVESGTTYTMWEYDEYVIHIPDREGLYEEIEENLDDWLTTGRTLEVNGGASILRDMEDALEILGYGGNDW